MAKEMKDEELKNVDGGFIYFFPEKNKVKKYESLYAYCPYCHRDVYIGDYFEEYREEYNQGYRYNCPSCGKKFDSPDPEKVVFY